jgi:hypothetical protein
MSVWMGLRLLKWIGLALYGAGLVGALTGETPQARAKAVHRWATLGFVALWVSGWGLARLSGISTGSTWISASMLLSLLAMQLLVWATEQLSPEIAKAPGRKWAARVALVLSLVLTGLMVARPGNRPASSPYVEVAP